MATTSESDRPAGYIPEECLVEFYKATTTPFLELIIYRERDGQFEYLYQDRQDKWWDGFCAFGGMVRKNQPSSPVEIAQALINQEFKRFGLRVESLRVVSFLRWLEHPWCNPFAVVCLIKVAGETPDVTEHRWLSVDSLPKNMVANHGLYLLQCEYFLRTGRPLLFTPESPNGLPATAE